MNVLDILAHNDDALEKYHSLYNEWKQLDRELSELTALAEQSRTDEDYLCFQLEQIEEAHLVEGEQSLLEQEAETLPKKSKRDFTASSSPFSRMKADCFRS